MNQRAAATMKRASVQARLLLLAVSRFGFNSIVVLCRLMVVVAGASRESRVTARVVSS